MKNFPDFYFTNCVKKNKIDIIDLNKNTDNISQNINLKKRFDESEIQFIEQKGALSHRQPKLNNLLANNKTSSNHIEDFGFKNLSE